MKNTNLIYIISFLFIGLISCSTSSKNTIKDVNNWKYEIEVVQQGTQGTYLIKVWSYSKKPDLAIDQAKKNAIHGIIFKGYTGNSSVQGQKPLTNNPNLENEKAPFFKQFFENEGKYNKFISLSNDGAVAAEDRMRVGNEFKIGVVVSVNVSLLRKYLEDEGIIKSINSGF
jgi:hypothetical protein